MNIEIVRQKRKTICLKLIDSEQARLFVPMRVSDSVVNKFIDEKSSWLNKHSQKMKKEEEFSTQFELLNDVYAFGKCVGNFSDLIKNYDKLNDKQKALVVKRYYISKFDELENMSQNLSNRFGLTFDCVKAVSSKRMWGSYSTTRVMKLNWKLLIVPENLVFYVICHELSHSKHMNHKKEFWALVEKLCPNYKILKKELNRYSFLLANGI